MTDFYYLIPVALVLGVGGLAAFLWSLRNGQYEDLDGAAERILFDEDKPLGAESSADRSEEGSSPLLNKAPDLNLGPRIDRR